MFYEDVAEAMENRTHYLFIANDFNAKLGQREEESETFIGYDQRNARGDTLLNLYVGDNTTKYYKVRFFNAKLLFKAY